MLWLKQIFKKIFLEDWVMKLVALAITLALWLGVTGLSTPTTQRFSSIPLTLRFSNNIEVTNSSIQEVDLLVTGDKRKLAQINKNDLIVSMDISDVVPGDRVLNLTPESVSVIPLPTGVKLEEIQPGRIAVRIEAVEEKEIAVKTETIGGVPEGYEVYSETITPTKVRVRGPANFIRSLTSVSTERIDLANRIVDFTAKQVPVSVSNPKAAVLETVVDVAFRIGEKRIERVYSVPVDGGKRASVVLFGGKSLFENVRTENLRVELDGNNEPRLTLPPGLDGKVEIRSVKLRG
ncbi:MAG TPA: CdaR family protein [Pyrinomonadaceae bacterium]|nr:CdaR family protein [Pyrinomonadaceae bacterium]